MWLRVLGCKVVLFKWCSVGCCGAKLYGVEWCDAKWCCAGQYGVVMVLGNKLCGMV